MSNYPQFTTLSEVVRFHAEKNAEQQALIFDGRATTYSELDRHARQLANGLAQLLQRQQRFAVLSKNNDWFYELLMATGKCAAVLVGIHLASSSSPIPPFARLATPIIVLGLFSRRDLSTRLWRFSSPE